ncbi:MAG TPA: hypothetical protein VK955_14345, partial [Xanthobacteraceae bacterium]|nr:hypothetical protein [Xanthobacteraceae bacterium]
MASALEAVDIEFDAVASASAHASTAHTTMAQERTLTLVMERALMETYPRARILAARLARQHRQKMHGAARCCRRQATALSPDSTMCAIEARRRWFGTGLC